MQLYVWYNFDPDYNPGIAFAMANSVEEARSLIVDQIKKSVFWPTGGGQRMCKDLEAEPKVYTAPYGDFQSGDG